MLFVYSYIPDIIVEPWTGKNIPVSAANITDPDLGCAENYIGIGNIGTFFSYRHIGYWFVFMLILPILVCIWKYWHIGYDKYRRIGILAKNQYRHSPNPDPSVPLGKRTIWYAACRRCFNTQTFSLRSAIVRMTDSCNIKLFCVWETIVPRRYLRLLFSPRSSDFPTFLCRIPYHSQNEEEKMLQAALGGFWKQPDQHSYYGI